MGDILKKIVFRPLHPSTDVKGSNSLNEKRQGGFQ